MPAQVERDHVKAVGELLGEPGKVAAVARHPVQADERGRAGIAPLVARERHVEAASGPLTSSSRRWSGRLTSVQTTTPVLSIRKVPRTGAPRSSLKTP